MNINFDASASETLLVCECGWRDLQVGAAAAWRAARKHVYAVHPADHQARDQIQRRKKFALTSC